jgi:hypothetical protein
LSRCGGSLAYLLIGKNLRFFPAPFSLFPLRSAHGCCFVGGHRTEDAGRNGIGLVASKTGFV